MYVWGIGGRGHGIESETCHAIPHMPWAPPPPSSREPRAGVCERRIRTLMNAVAAAQGALPALHSHAHLGPGAEAQGSKGIGFREPPSIPSPLPQPPQEPARPPWAIV